MNAFSLLHRGIIHLQRHSRRLVNMRFKGINVYTIGTYGITLFKDVDTLTKNTSHFQEFDKFLEQGRVLYKETALRLSGKVSPIKFDSGEELGSFLYAFVMHKKPQCVVETGVANGLTTNMIMAALETYGGELHSFDINPNCQSVYSGEGRWRFHLLERDYKKQVKKTVKSLHNVELWIHDSDHSHSWQSFEYSLAAHALKSNEGFLVSDDIDCTTAFGKITKKLNLPGWAVFDSRKFFGIVQIKS